MNKILFLLLLIILVVMSTVSGCHFFFSGQKTNNDTKPPIEEPLPTNREHAELILKNLAVGMRLYSAMNGGGGEARFTNDMTKIQNHVMQAAFAACTGKIPFHGFIVELTEYPLGDDFKTNFRFIAKPAPGYKGETYAIDKTEEIISLNNQEK